MQVVGRGDLLVLVQKRAGHQRFEHRDAQLVVAQRRVGIGQHALGQHGEIFEHGPRRGGAAHQRIHRRAVGRPVGKDADIGGEGLEHVQRVDPRDEERVREIEPVPVVIPEEVAALLRIEPRRRNFRQKHRRRGIGSGSRPLAGIAAAARRARQREQTKCPFPKLHSHFPFRVHTRSECGGRLRKRCAPHARRPPSARTPPGRTSKDRNKRAQKQARPHFAGLKQSPRHSTSMTEG